ncbi:MAG: hypothetical protein LPK19_07010, partial [Hymenobacteraceae bacterium]|nr:hypothetical protein [Hymenobacteraceae bacterium]MDX5395952.1 hypothetical protein [Hymenobacteraceae bacterium]MDX5512012.1 hypothetical protein [Hymenobacteraceae bacterium]
NNEIKEEKKFFDQLARHFVFGGEFLLGKNFHVRAGYNHLRRKELRMEDASGGAGFSMGAMLRIRSFQLDYGRAWYHTAGAANYITVTSNLQSLFKPKEASN